MRVHAHIVDGPIAPAAGQVAESGNGAVLIFEGVVRPTENGAAIDSLEYEAYEPMASNMLLRTARAVAEEFGVTSMEVTHSRGVVGAGEVSLRVRIESAHRGESLAAMAAFIDLLKKDVPIWKRVRTDDDSA